MDESKDLPWWRTLFELRLKEGGWEEPETVTKQDVAFLAKVIREHWDTPAGKHRGVSAGERLSGSPGEPGGESAGEHGGTSGGENQEQSTTDQRAPVRVLDVGCGTGRHTIGLAGEGFDVLGIDIGPALVDEATRRTPDDLPGRARFEVGDMRDLRYREQFEAAILMDASFGFFDDHGNYGVLKQVAGALVPGGVFLLEVFNVPALARMVGRDWFETEQRAVLRETVLDIEKAVIEFRGISIGRKTGERTVHPVQRIRFYTLPELRILLEGCGFEVVAVYGGKSIDEGADNGLKEGSLFMEVVARRR